MFRFVACLCFIAVPTVIGGIWSPALKSRFDVNPLGFGTKSFIPHPLSQSEAFSKGYLKVTRPTPSPPGLEILELWCPAKDYTVCVLYDDTGYIAGKQVAFDIEIFKDAKYDWKTQGFTQWTANENGQTKNYWTTQQYFISAGTLATDPETRIKTRDQATILQDGAIWVSGFYGELYNISTTVSDITNKNSPYTKQACIPGMGLHYYYKMTPEITCSDDSLFPWFPLIQSNQLIGVGMVVFGKYQVPQGKTNWFEKPNRLAVKVIVPRGPECLYNLADETGLVTMHTYFINHPYFVNCVIQ